MSADVTKDLLEALKGLMALSDHRVDLRDEAKAARAAIARAEAALAEPHPDADGWILWVGTTKHPTDIPPNTAVEVKLRSGATAVRNIAQSTVSVVLAPEGIAYGFDWTIYGTAGDIIAYRVVKL